MPAPRCVHITHWRAAQGSAKSTNLLRMHTTYQHPRFCTSAKKLPEVKLVCSPSFVVLEKFQLHLSRIDVRVMISIPWYALVMCCTVSGSGQLC